MPVPKSGRGTNTKKNGTSVGQEIHSDNTLYQGMRPSFYALKGNMENRTKTGIKGIVQNGTAKPEANGHNNSTAIGGKGDNCNGFTNGSSKVYSGNGKNKLKKANGNKSDGIPSYVHSNGKRNESSKDFQLDDADCQSNGSQGHQDAVPIRKRIALQEFYESDIAVDMANEKNPIAANKCSEEPLSFFQPDFEDALKSPTVEELCAKWPVLGNIQEPNDSKDEPVNDVPLLISRAKQNVRSKISSKWGNSNKTASEIQAPSDITLSPDGASQRHQMNVLESIQPDSKTACKSDLGDARADTSNCSLSKVGKLPSLSCYGNKRARQPSESSAWANSQQSSPRKSNAPRFEGRGQNGNQNSMGRGGPRKNKTAKKFNTQGLQFDNKKHFGLSGPIQNQRSPIAQYDKSGTPVGYYNNHEAFMGQHLIASMPSLIGPEVVQPQMMNEMAQPLMVNPGATQPQNMNPSGQYTVAILPNGAYGTNQWIDVGNQQYLVHQSEMGPITIANVLPYVVPYTPGLPNTGIPMMIPAIAPPGIATPVQESVNTSQATADPNCLDTQLNGNYYSNNTQVDVNNQDLAASQSVSVHTGPILAYSQSPNHFSPAHHGKPTEYGYPQETSGNPVVYPPNNGWFQTSHDNPGNGEAALNETMHNSNNIIATTQSDTPKSAHTRNPDGSSLQQTHSPNAITKLNVAAPSAIAADYHTPRSYPGTPTHNIVNSGNGTPVALKSMPVTPVHCSTPPTQTVAPSSATGDTNDSPLTIAPKTPKDAPKTGKGSASKIRMMSVSQVEKIQRMSSANGKRLPLNSRNKDSPNHMPAAPQEVQEDLVKFICDSWNKVHQEYQKGSNGVAYYDQEPCPLEGFVPFDLEAYWGNRLVQNMTNQNIPTQNI